MMFIPFINYIILYYNNYKTFFLDLSCIYFIKQTMGWGSLQTARDDGGDNGISKEPGRGLVC